MTTFPQTIYIIRHGEKQPTSGEVIPQPQASSPEYGPPTNGVDVAGSEAAGTTKKHDNKFDPVKDSLIPRGWQRAGALTALFGKLPALGGPFKQPTSIVATAYPGPDPNKPGKPLPPIDVHLTHVHRPYQTVQPLAEKLGLDLDISHQLGDEQHAMTDDILRLGGIVLVCWEHDHIYMGNQSPGGLVDYIPSDGGNWPTTPWPGKRFDLVWQFELTSDGTHYAFTPTFQDLLLGDATTVD